MPHARAMRAFRSRSRMMCAWLRRTEPCALALPATQAKLKPLEAEPMFGTPADYASFLVSELPKWINMAKLSGAAAE